LDSWDYAWVAGVVLLWVVVVGVGVWAVAAHREKAQEAPASVSARRDVATTGVLMILVVALLAWMIVSDDWSSLLGG
jgi:hypothetical protein